MIERRTARRYDLSLPVVVTYSNRTGCSSCTGNTRDISTQGVYSTLDNDLSIGAELDLTVIIPAEVTGGAEVFLRTITKVVRLDKRSRNGDRPVGFAAVIKRYEIVRSDAGRPQSPPH